MPSPPGPKSFKNKKFVCACESMLCGICTNEVHWCPYSCAHMQRTERILGVLYHSPSYCLKQGLWLNLSWPCQLRCLVSEFLEAAHLCTQQCGYRHARFFFYGSAWDSNSSLVIYIASAVIHWIITPELNKLLITFKKQDTLKTLFLIW